MLFRSNALLENKKFNALILILFFLPGVPKDILTYVVGLSGKITKTYFTQMMLARFPSIAASAIAGNAAANGDIRSFLIIYGVIGIIGFIGIIIHSKIAKS